MHMMACWKNCKNTVQPYRKGKKKQYDKWTVITKMVCDQLVIFTRLHSPLSSQQLGVGTSKGQLTKDLAW